MAVISIPLSVFITTQLFFYYNMMKHKIQTRTLLSIDVTKQFKNWREDKSWSIASTANAAFTILALCRANKNFTSPVTTQRQNWNTYFCERFGNHREGGRETDGFGAGKFDWKKFGI